MSTSHPRLGALKQRVEILTRSESVEDDGSVANSFVSLGSFWATIVRQTSAISALENGRAARVNKQFIIRSGPSVSVGDQLIFQAENFEVKQVHDLDGQKAFLRIDCEQLLQKGGAS